MELWVNIGFAWITLILAFLLIVIWALRLINKKKKIVWVQKANRTLRRHHKLVGILLIGTALIHGIFSSDKLFSLNWGTANWIVSILLGLSWLFRKKFNPRKWWIYVHRTLTVAFAGIFLVHILSVGGFILDDMIAGRIKPPPVLAAQAKPIAAENTPEATTEAEPAPTTSVYEVLPTMLPSAAQEVFATAAPDPTPTPAPTPTPSKYIDGVYQGTGEGFRPGLVVEVVIESDIIISVSVIDHNEQNKRYWGYPVEVVPQWIVEAQSTDVDTVSGATWTSIGIQAAVEDALIKALR